MKHKTFNLDINITKIFLQKDVLFIGSDNIVSMDILNGKIIETYNTNDLEYPSALFVNENYIFAGYENGNIIKINISTNRIEDVFTYSKKKVYNISVVNNKLFSSSTDNTLIIYDLENEKIIKKLNNNSTFKCNFIISDNSLYYIGNSENKIIQYDIFKNEIINIFTDSSPILCIFVNKTSKKLIISSADEYIKGLNQNTKDFSNIMTLETIFDFVYFEDNNLYLSKSSTNEITKINITQAAIDSLETTILTLPDDITGIVVSKNIIVSSIDGTVRIYENIIEEEDSKDFNNIITNKSNLKNEDYYKNINCTNYNVFTLENYTRDDDPIQIYTLNNQNTFEISNCITIDELTHHLNSGKDTIHPTMLMSICTPTSNATGRIVISMPPNNLFYTYGSIEKLFLNKENKTWFALPLFGGKRRRIGNLDEAPLVGSLHCQIPGYKVYKLYTKEEIDQTLEVKETVSDYPMFLYNNSSKLFELGNTNIKSTFINKLIDNLLNK